MVKKTRMGRPPAEWAYRLAKLPKNDNEWFDIYELSEILGIPYHSIRIFLHRFTFTKKYCPHEGVIRAKYNVRDLKKVIGDYVSQWPSSQIHMHS